ncbi:helix-turn-helix domain-containing protein [Costertonia aggregata]|uniref:AraC family transcriptional regulator n=1 Tax=Costertonia aggregata TaxID=343403 RepID=A0A7H9ALD1_9FLAO|nr:helix-turn-helix domain-containing protein [Costertonia aggregata]QLG44207.1 AraC family transcriptional regulator [Costertonia aggregata]
MNIHLPFWFFKSTLRWKRHTGSSMDLNYNLYAFLDTVGLIQGLTLGILLIIINKKKHKSTFFLGLFLLLYAVERINPILESLDIYKFYPELYRLPFNFFWLLYPLFYVYTQQVCIFADKKIQYWVLYPGILAFFVQVVIFFLPYEEKLIIVDTLWFKAFIICGFIYGIIIGIWNLKLISNHKSEVKNVFSLLESKELQWAKVFLLFAISGSILYIIQYYALPNNVYSNIFFVLFDLIVIYWVSYHGVEQRNVLSLLSKSEMFGNKGDKIPSQPNLPVNSYEGMKELMVEIDDYMKQSESFMQTELTIVDVAKGLNIHPKRISTTINTMCHVNFNTYVNQFRIRKAEKLLDNQEDLNLSIEGIGNEVGFHSKSAFYAAFKKITGTTPTKYKQGRAKL